MRVILIQDVDGLGKKYEIKDVKPGHARNYLIPNKLVQPATEKAMKWLEIQTENIKKSQEEDFKKSQSMVSKVDGSELIFSLKVGEKGQLFESISEQKIKEKIEKELGIKISKNQIKLKDPIKEVGDFLIKIEFDHNLEANVKVVVTEDN
jgi:large subunit ribosomal protein L9